MRRILMPWALALVLVSSGGAWSKDCQPDRLAPTVKLKASPVLWPADHQYDEVTVAKCFASVTDNCTAAAKVVATAKLVRAWSDEPEKGQGCGDSSKDIVLDCSKGRAQLRAERNAAGNGRVYSIEWKFHDAAGNATYAVCKVLVPVSTGKKAPPTVDDAPAFVLAPYAATCACQAAADCNDGIGCTVDACVAGKCTNLADDGVCGDGIFCNGAETCSTMLGCQPAAMLPLGTPCDDGDATTQADVCDGRGNCFGTAVPVDNCCLAHPEPGCSDPVVSQCVCKGAPDCCDKAWTEQCAVDVLKMGCGPCCGNGACDWTEDCTVCPKDCGACPYCGDASCDADEDCWNCPADCGVCTCPSGVCEKGETCATCPADCGACPFCGDGACNNYESCLSCPADCGACSGDCCREHDAWGCGDPTVTACVCAMNQWCCAGPWNSKCTDAVVSFGCGTCCGNGSCEWNESCGTCPQDCGACPYCGDGTCGAGEDCWTCPADCAACVCPSGTCEAGETCATCPADCGACPFCGDGSCNGSENCSTCAADCGACSGDCCAEHKSPGCADPVVTQCVCAVVPECCTSTWGPKCVEVIPLKACGACP